MLGQRAYNRTLVALKIADTVTQEGIPTALVKQLDAAGWTLLARFAKASRQGQGYVPSHHTRELVLAILRERDETTSLRNLDNGLVGPNAIPGCDQS